MVVRIRLTKGRPLTYKSGKNRKFALAFGGLLVPFAVIAYVMGVWRLAADMGAAGGMGLEGVWSHWQVWLPLAALAHLVATTLTKYGIGGELHWPRLLSHRVLSAPEEPKHTVLDLSK